MTTPTVREFADLMCRASTARITALEREVMRSDGVSAAYPESMTIRIELLLLADMISAEKATRNVFYAASNQLDDLTYERG